MLRPTLGFDEAAAILKLLDSIVEDESTLVSVVYDQEIVYSESPRRPIFMHLTVYVTHFADKMRMGSWSTTAGNIDIEVRFEAAPLEFMYAPDTKNRRTPWAEFKLELEAAVAVVPPKAPMDLRIELLESPDRATLYINGKLAFDGEYFGWQDLAHLFGISHTRHQVTASSYLAGVSMGQEDLVEALGAVETDPPEIVTHRDGPAGSVCWKVG